MGLVLAGVFAGCGGWGEVFQVLWCHLGNLLLFLSCGFFVGHSEPVWIGQGINLTNDNHLLQNIRILSSY